MQIVFAFGNPGSQYNFTRHNFGFLAADFYAKKYGLSWSAKPKFFAEVAKDEERDILLVKPQTFYNEVGKSIQAVCAFYKIKTQDILVLCDDFHLDFGKLRFRERGSAGGNNGLKSAIQMLGTEDFPRLRLGTGNDPLRAKIGDIDFVLSRFSEEEKAKLPETLMQVVDFIQKY